jgi:glutathione S-transferase
MHAPAASENTEGMIRPGRRSQPAFRTTPIQSRSSAAGTHPDVAIVTLLSGLAYFWMAATVSRIQAKTGILAPTMTGDPRLERAVRAHANTAEWMPICLPATWLFANLLESGLGSPALGAVWIIGRVIYFLGYLAALEKRLLGFFIQSCAAFAVMLGALGRIVCLLMTSPAS